MGKLDNYQDALVRNELEKAKTQLKLEMSDKIEELENEFSKKLQATKKICEKTVIKLKSAYLDENSNLKQLIKVFIILFRNYMMILMTLRYKSILRIIRLNFIRRK
jgi:hypothetical protein